MAMARSSSDALGTSGFVDDVFISLGQWAKITSTIIFFEGIRYVAVPVDVIQVVYGRFNQKAAPRAKSAIYDCFVPLIARNIA